MNIALLGGFETPEQAEKHRHELKHPELYEVATLYQRGEFKQMGSFIIPIKAADVISNWNEDKEYGNKD
jgi:hypothetical protein